MAIRTIPVLGITPADVTNGYFISDLTDDPGYGKFVDAKAARDFSSFMIDAIVTHSLTPKGTDLYAMDNDGNSYPLDYLVVTDNNGTVIRSGSK